MIYTFGTKKKSRFVYDRVPWLISGLFYKKTLPRVLALKFRERHIKRRAGVDYDYDVGRV